MIIGSLANGIFFTSPYAYTQQAGCDPSYPEVCIPPYPPDLNSGDVSDRRFAVLPPDAHGFDWNNDGIGCEIGGEPTGGLLPQGTVQMWASCSRDCYVDSKSHVLWRREWNTLTN